MTLEDIEFLVAVGDCILCFLVGIAIGLFLGKESGGK
jgi:hypothetical protein